ncbi:MAG: hypothetical protein N2250_09355 [Pseudothermotoga sp.]|nr:hypothetical protein [Pseudothermotoga sp.]
MKKLVITKKIDLSKSRDRERMVVPARFLYVLSCPQSLFVSFTEEDDQIDLKNVKMIDLGFIREMFLTNTAANGEAVLLFTGLPKIEFKL